ncbi:MULTISPECIES: thiamine phosphate synthase [unclassified Vibrio]|uniref:thiamine phosphate synthase n=1 Tax=unclassified Vibrio TaxID=2614977 RepID=UPI000C836A3D|nr:MULTISPECIES: thiamine phosphate synthase [unclassified Vibrio]PMI20812.1 thiamine-phosphate diphosphorylase [Vibrio sp. 10N.286.46.E10]PMJ00186.1 thiamine-phosphate diphosphorylase [Vibrio sp. 10N.286.45.E10]PTO90116.1 thiamine phosphate synthase [Vibrio sp. 10N.286.48.B8]PTO95420.1 thiamine phosphate synthase [Vibrio sp. 10N.286.45.A3]PTQ19935.1 thiamine phosphate synthase [Vibrio sp. 10N.286.46.E10]
MTVKILIPSQNIELTGEVQNCLLVAKRQGLATDAVELGVSPTQYFSIVDTQQALSIGFAHDVDSLAECQLAELNHVVDYSNSVALTDVCAALTQASNTVYIGVSDDSAVLDIWSHLDANRVIKSETTAHQELDNRGHFAWLLTLLALEFPLEDALVLARAASNVSRGTWPAHYQSFPIPVLEDERLNISVGWANQGTSLSFPELTKNSLGLYPVVDDVEWIDRLLKLGINTVQLRIKNPQQADLEQQVARSIELGREHNAQVFINDYWQLALKHGAFGVHLGQEDIEESNLSQLSQAGIKIGLSTHGYYELLRIVQINPSYIALGHIFPTTTKQMPSKPQGLVRLSLYQQLIDTIPYTEELTGYPTVAIGGIDQSTAAQVWECGVSSLAVVRAITLAEDPKQVIEFFEVLMADSSTSAAKEITQELSHAE